jgi:hypothetical protein
MSHLYPYPQHTKNTYVGDYHIITERVIFLRNEDSFVTTTAVKRCVLSNVDIVHSVLLVISIVDLSQWPYYTRISELSFRDPLRRFVLRLALTAAVSSQPLSR